MTDALSLVLESEKRLFVGLAGPGTGKSHTFKTFVKSSEYNGKKILVLSFINKLVDDLKNDFADFRNVEVSTLHAFAMQEYIKHSEGETELDEGLDDIITQDYAFLLEESLDYRNKYYESSITTDEEAFYKSRSAYYGNGKTLHSFNSVIYALNQLFQSNNDLLPTYDLILVDEFQDFNELEWQFISTLNLKSKVVVVGDDDQSLYSWKSAQPNLIRDLFADETTDSFSLDYCYRSTQVIVDAVNSLIVNAKSAGLLTGRVDEKQYMYPAGRDDKDELSAKFSKIDFLPAINGSLLSYQLAARIKRDTQGSTDKRILVLAPSFYKQALYDGLISQGLNVVEFELFGAEKHKTIKHKHLIESFKTLETRKTDTLSLRKVLHIYADEVMQKDLIQRCATENKKIWLCLPQDIKNLIEADIALFKKVRQGKDALSNDELVRLNQIFNLKNLLSKMINGFGSHTKSGLEVEMTTVMSSKGLSADFVYYIGVDDNLNVDKVSGELTDSKICEFLVGITRAKEKLTLFSFRDESPKLVELISEHVNRIESSRGRQRTRT
ncbi:MAG TPA: UvrD-helicase domain-containing protein [Flavisolibacter sp.]|nr:UvrD-helicase domain-containing protein [Flavisolibacter sp.]